MSNRTVTILLLASIGVVVALALVVGNRGDPSGVSDFPGSDSQATELVADENPDYSVWFEPVFTPPSGQIESGLFALQAALGGGVFGYVVAALRGRRQLEAAVAAADDLSRASSPR